MREWDPIGVAESSGARDEYDSYIPGIIGLLEKGQSAEDVAAHLDAIVSDRMSLSPPRERSEAAAVELLRVWQGPGRFTA